MSDITHAEYTGVAHFTESCKLAGVEPTKRQASKYRRRQGVAYKAKRKFVTYEGEQKILNNEDAITKIRTNLRAALKETDDEDAKLDMVEKAGKLEAMLQDENQKLRLQLAILKQED